MENEIVNQITILSGFTALFIQTVLRLKVIPVQFANKYPVPTNIILSIIATIVVYAWNINTLPSDIWGWITTVGVISAVNAITYNALPRNWTQLRDMEG